MEKSGTKNKSPALFFVLVFAAIVVIMFVANRSSYVVKELRFPLNNGVSMLSTYGKFLAAVCNDHKIYVWDWSDMSKKPRVCDIDSDQAVLLEQDAVISLRRIDPEAVVIFDLDDGKIRSEISLPPKSSRAYLVVNSNRSCVAVLLEESEDTQPEKKSYQLLKVDVENGATYPIAGMKTKSDNSRVMDVAMSEDGKTIVAVGEKNRHAWLFAIDASRKGVAWEKELEDLRQISKVVFAPDGSVIYARGSDSVLLRVAACSGQITGRLLAGRKNESTYRVQAVQDVDASGDGRLVACVVGYRLYIWDCRTDTVLCERGTGQKLISGIAFSADSEFLATSSMRQGKHVKILEVPRQ